MKKFLSLICLMLVACTVLSACGGAVDTEAETDATTETTPETDAETEEVETVKTYTMAEARDLYRALGRTKILNSSLICDWNACGAEFAMDCEGDVEITFTGSGTGYLIVYVDDVFYKDIAIQNGKRNYTVAEDLQKGFHMIRVITSYSNYMGSMDAIRLDGSLIKLSQGEAYVEIIGDSITCGAFLGPTGNDYSASGYAYIAMKKVDADYAICAKGGMPLSIPSTINDVYPYFNKNRDNTPYEPERTADLIIVNLGTNDNWQWYKQADNKLDHDVFNYENFDAGMETFIKNLDKIHGEKAVPILFVFGCTTVDSRKVATDRMQELIKDVYIPAGYDIDVVFLPTNRAGKDGHPDAAGAKQQGEALAEYLKTNYSEIFG